MWIEDLSMLPISEPYTIIPPSTHQPYWGNGVSNQVARNNDADMTTPGISTVNSSLYISALPNLLPQVLTLEAEMDDIIPRVEILETTVVSLQNQIDDITADTLVAGPVGTAPNVNGLSLTLVDPVTTLNLQPANGTNPGVLTAIPQTIGGDKTFADDIIAQKTIDIAQTVDATTGVISMGGNPYIHSYGHVSNTFMGAFSCVDNTPAPSTENTAFGGACLSNIIAPAQGNTALGNACLTNLTTGQGNVAVGWNNLFNSSAGDNNIAIGTGLLFNATGSENIAIGHNVGNSITSADNTINIGSVGSNTSGEINIGTSGTHTKTSIAGIAGVAPGGTPQAVIVNAATGQLGSTTLQPAITLGTIPAVPVADGATLVGGVLTLQPATTNFQGIMTLEDQSFRGSKIFSDGIVTTGMEVNLEALFNGNMRCTLINGPPLGNIRNVAIDSVTGLLGSLTPPINTKSAVINFTLTLNGGATVASVIVRGVTQATVPVTFWRVGDIVTALFPQFAVNFGAGTPNVITFSATTPASYRPSNNQRSGVMLVVNSAATNGLLNIITDGSFQMVAVPIINMPGGSGLFYDQTFTWAVL